MHRSDCADHAHRHTLPFTQCMEIYFCMIYYHFCSGSNAAEFMRPGKAPLILLSRLTGRLTTGFTAAEFAQTLFSLKARMILQFMWI